MLPTYSLNYGSCMSVMKHWLAVSARRSIFSSEREMKRQGWALNCLSLCGTEYDILPISMLSLSQLQFHRVLEAVAMLSTNPLYGSRMG